jgi:hypothetical protein
MTIKSVKRVVPILGLAGLLAAAGSPAIAGGHTWQVSELFSNADGTIQFVELKEPAGATAENSVSFYFVTSTARSYDITTNVAGNTAFKTLLFGTPAFCALFNQLPGNPTCDFQFSAGQTPFFVTSGDTVGYSALGQHVTFAAGQLPTDGVNSLNANLTTGPNSPRNYAGGTGQIDATPPPAGVPDGSAGSTPMQGSRLDAAGTSLSVSWDTATCAAHPDHLILYGDKSQFPAIPGGNYALTGSACAIGAASPYTWNSVPDAGDGSGLLWWVVVVNKGTIEGSWGDASAGERAGTGAGGSSGQCGVTSRSLSNVCGH